MDEKRNKNKQRGIKLVISFIIAFSIMFMYLVCGPVEVYAYNSIDFDFLLKDFLGFFIFISIVISIVYGVITIFLPLKLYNILSIFLASFNVVSYIQYIFLNIRVANEDGTMVSWDERTGYIIGLTIVWVIIFVIVACVLTRLKNNRYKFLAIISIFLIVIQGTALISNLVRIHNTGKVISNYRIDGKDQFCVADGNNIIVIVLDTLGNGSYEKAKEKDPHIDDFLNDFTYYNNYDSLYFPTNPSLTHMFTGYEPDTKDSRYQWAQRAWMSERCVRFWEKLHNNGYTCNEYTYEPEYTFGSTDFLNGKIDNVINVSPRTNYRLMMPMMIKYSAFRYSPYALKPNLEVNISHFRGAVEYTLKEPCVELNHEFREKTINKGITIRDDWENALIIQHLRGIHGLTPQDPKEGLTKEERIYTSMGAVEEYLNQLKSVGKYDDSVIIITADHGTGEADDVQSIFFIKRAGETHDSIIINSSPISSDDFQATILSLIGENYEEYGTTIDDWCEGDKRERITYITGDNKNPGIMGYKYFSNRQELEETYEDGYDVRYPSNEWN